MLEQLFGAGPRIHLRLTAAPKAHVSVERTAKKIQKASDHSSGCLGLGEGLDLISSSACSGCSSLWGGAPSAISNAVMPSDHTSALPVYSSRLTISGAIQ